ncbi:MAG: 50S ribosomal protein L28 [Deltaproteobacteria bacterium]|nr:50S ribosomal protein L28 [Deltaproteobacteria bacterium]
MAKCQLTGKSWMNGHQVSHSNIKTKKKWKVNVQTKRVFDIESGRWVKLKISTSALKTLNKMSLSEYIRKNS